MHDMKETLRAGAHERGLSKSGGSLPKIKPLPGSIQAERKRCGKANCRCARGELHGPYIYRRWREKGRQRKQYIRPKDARRVRASLAEWRRLHPPTWTVRQMLAELRRLDRIFDLIGL